MIKKIFAGLLVVTAGVATIPAPVNAALDQTLIDAIINLVAAIAPDAVPDVQAALSGTGTTTSTGTTGTTCSTTASYSHTVTLRVGSRGAKVVELQTKLNSLGFNVGSADGIFGNGTKTGVVAYQSSKGLVADGIVGPGTGGMLASSVCTTPNTGTETPGTTPVVTGNTSVTLAASTPATSAIVAGSGIADLAHFTFSNGNSSEMKITNLVFNRTGVSVDTTISKAYIFDAMGKRLSDSATVSNGKISFNAPNGLFTVPANSAMTVSFRANIATGTAGQFLGVALSSYTAMGGSAMTTNLMGNVHTIATATLAGVNFNNTTSPSSASNVDAQDNFRLWQNTVSVTNEDVMVYSVTFRQTGSADSGDLTNLKFYVKGQQKGATMPSFDATNHVTFDFSASPILLTAGSSELKLTGDITGDTANETIQVMIREAADFVAKDTGLGVFVTPQENSSSFATVDTAIQTVNAGTLTFTKASDSPSGTVVDDASSVVFGRWEVRSFGEQVKIENLGFDFTTSTDSGSALSHLRNVAVFVDGVQIGSTASLAQSGSTYQFGSSFVVNPGAARVIELRGDIYDDNGAEGTDSADAFQVRITAGTNNVEKLSSAGFLSAPSGAVAANSLTIGTGVPTLAEDVTYGDRTTVAPKTAYKLADFALQADSTEGINITGLDIDFTGADVADASDDLQNLYVVIGSYTSTIKSAVSDSGNNFSVNVDLPAGQSVEIAVYADALSSISDGGTADTMTVSDLEVSYTTLGSSTSGTVNTGAQTITFGTGDLTVELDGTSALSRIVAGNQTVTAAKYRFNGVSETYTIKELAVEVASASAASNVASAELYVDGVKVGNSAQFLLNSSTRALFTGLNIAIPANGSKTVEVRYNLVSVGGNNGSAGTNTFAKLETSATKVATSQGVESLISASPFSETDVNGNPLYIYRSVPTVSKQATGESNSSPDSTKTVYKWSVAADSAGDLSLKQFRINLSWVDAGATSTLGLGDFNLFENGVEITDKVAIMDQGGTNLEAADAVEADSALYIVWDAAQESTITAGGSNTYYLEGTFSGFTESGDSVALKMVGDSASQEAAHTYLATTTEGFYELHSSAASPGDTGDDDAKNFIWSDRSAITHVNNVGDSSSADWTNGFKVLNLDLGTETWKLQF